MKNSAENTISVQDLAKVLGCSDSPIKKRCREFANTHPDWCIKRGGVWNLVQAGALKIADDIAGIRNLKNKKSKIRQILPNSSDKSLGKGVSCKNPLIYVVVHDRDSIKPKVTQVDRSDDMYNFLRDIYSY